MKSILVYFMALLFILGTLTSPALSFRKAHGQAKKPVLSKQIVQKIEKRITRLSPVERQELRRVLKGKLQRIKKNLRTIKQAKRLAALRMELLRVEKEIDLIIAMEVSVAAKPGKPAAKLIPPGIAKKPLLVPPRARPKLQPKPKAKARRPRPFQFGLSAGYIANIPGAMLEMRFFEPMELRATSMRIGVAYAEGKDSDQDVRKHVLLVLDGIYRLNPPHTRGMRSYLGLGLNYDVYTTGQTSGTLGGQAFYGVEGNMGVGQLFAEVGYGTIRTGFSPDYAGLSATLGYKF